MQLGDDTFVHHGAANVNVAGDSDDLWAPTYASFTGLLQAESHQPGDEIVEQILREGQVSINHAYHGYYNVKIAAYVAETDHSIAEPFWAFMTSTGQIYENGSYQNDRLFKNPFYATGFPITEPYWTTVKVKGDSTHVLVQCFERRCLTYTSTNPDGWQVEAGNIGQHYYIWRYGALPPAAPNAALEGTQ